MSTEPQIISRPRKWPFYLGAVLTLLVLLYFVVTSSPFLRRFVLPSVETALGSQLNVGELRLSPFSQLELRDVTVTPQGAEPLAKIGLLRMRYQLTALLGGQIQAHEVTLENPVITLIEKADGSRNLPKLPASKPKAASEVRLDLHLVQLRNGTLTYQKQLPNGTAERTAITGLNLTLDQLVTGQLGKLSLSADVQNDPSTTDRIGGKLTGDFEMTPGKLGLPILLKGGLKLDASSATGIYQNLQGLGLAFDTDIAEKEIRDFRLTFRRNGQELGRGRFFGPYDVSKSEAHLTYELAGFDRRVLALLGAAAGIDLGNTSVAAQGRIDVTQDGNVVGSNGELTVGQFSLGNPPTPVTDVRARYQGSVDLAHATALLELFEVAAKDSRGEWLSGTLDQPMNVAWGSAPEGVRKAHLALKLNRFSLAEWQSFLGSNAPTGNLHADLNLTAERDGRLLRFNLTGVAEHLHATVGTSQLTDGLVEFSNSGTVTNLQQVVMEQFAFSLKQNGTALFSATGLADYHLTNHLGAAQISGEGEIVPLLALAPIPGISLQAGKVKLNAQANYKTTGATANLTLGLSQFSGKIRENVLQDYQTTIQFNGSKVGDLIEIQRFNLAAQTGTYPGGTVDASGRWDVVKRTGIFDYKFVNLTESALRPWLEPSLKPNRLQSVTLNSSGQAQVDLKGSTKLNSELKISDFRTQNPTGDSAPALTLGFKLEASGQQTVLDLQRLTILLGATERAKNELVLSGRADLSTNNPAATTLSIRSEGLDLTPLYQLFAANSTSNAPPARVAQPRPEVEPESVTFPIQQFIADLDIGKIELGSVVVTHWKGRAELNRSVVTVKPCELSLNGTPVTFSLNANLGVPGWQYDFNLTAPSLVLAPLVDTFRPQYEGKVTGNLSARANFKGAGFTGAGFQKNLAGLLDLQSTNLNLNLASLQDAKKKQAARLVSKPKDGLLSLIGNAFRSVSGIGSGPSWYDQISGSPIDTVIVRIDAGAGRLTLKEGLIQSPVLRAQPTGSLAFAPALTNSTLNFPVELALRGSVARQFGLSRDTNKFAPLPSLLAVVGTLGTPDVKVDKLAVGQLLLKSQVGGTVGNLLNSATDGKSGAITDKLGGLFNTLTGTAPDATAGSGKAADSKTTTLPSTSTPPPQVKQTPVLTDRNSPKPAATVAPQAPPPAPASPAIKPLGTPTTGPAVKAANPAAMTVGSPKPTLAPTSASLPTNALSRGQTNLQTKSSTNSLKKIIGKTNTVSSTNGPPPPPASK